MPRSGWFVLPFALLLAIGPVWSDDDGDATKSADDAKSAPTDDSKDDASKADDTKADDTKTDTPKTDDPKPSDGDDPKPTDPPEDPKTDDADPDAPKPEVDPLEEWDRLSKRKKEIAAKLAELKKQYDEADRSARGPLREQFGDLVQEFQFEIADQMDELAAKVLATRPEDPQAAAILVREAFDENRYARVLELAAIVEKGGPSAGYEFRGVRRLAARAHFALHEFEECLAILGEVDDDSANFTYYGLQKDQLEPAAKEYVELWAKEQEIRTAEDALEGEERLPLVTFEIADAEGEPKGEVEMLLFSKEAPNTVANFVKTVKDGKYDGVPFHRVIANFVAQGGELDPPVEWTIDCECYEPDARMHFRGSLSMALSGKDTGSTQFFITVLPTHTLNPEIVEGVPVRGHTVFGRIVKGMDIVDAIEQVRSKDNADKIVKATVAEGRLDPGAPNRKGEETEEPDEPTTDGEKTDGEKTDDTSTTDDTKPDAPKDDAPKGDAPKEDTEDDAAETPGGDDSE